MARKPDLTWYRGEGDRWIVQVTGLPWASPSTQVDQARRIIQCLCSVPVTFSDSGAVDSQTVVTNVHGLSVAHVRDARKAS